MCGLKTRSLFRDPTKYEASRFFQQIAYSFALSVPIQLKSAVYLSKSMCIIIASPFCNPFFFCRAFIIDHIGSRKNVSIDFFITCNVLMVCFSFPSSKSKIVINLISLLLVINSLLRLQFTKSDLFFVCVCVSFRCFIFFML